MKCLTTWLMIAVLATAQFGCGAGPGTTGGNAEGDGEPVTSDEVTADDDKAMSTDDILKNQGEGGEADPDAPIRAGKKPDAGDDKGKDKKGGN